MRPRRQRSPAAADPAPSWLDSSLGGRFRRGRRPGPSLLVGRPPPVRRVRLLALRLASLDPRVSRRGGRRAARRSDICGSVEPSPHGERATECAGTTGTCSPRRVRGRRLRRGKPPRTRSRPRRPRRAALASFHGDRRRAARRATTLAEPGSNPGISRVSSSRSATARPRRSLPRRAREPAAAHGTGATPRPSARRRAHGRARGTRGLRARAGRAHSAGGAAARRAPPRSHARSAARIAATSGSGRSDGSSGSSSGSPHARTNARTTFVARDRRHPRRPRRAGTDPRSSGVVGGHEHLLRGVLRLDRVAQQQPAEAEHHPAVLGEELADVGAGRLGLEGSEAAGVGRAQSSSPPPWPGHRGRGRRRHHRRGRGCGVPR